MQASYRVGRQGDPCKRLILKDLPLIDSEKETSYKAKLFEFIQNNEQRPVIKMATTATRDQRVTDPLLAGRK